MMDDFIKNKGLYYISRQIFGYLVNFEDLKNASEVSKLWNGFLMKEKSLWLPHFDITSRSFIDQLIASYDDAHFMEECDSDDDLMEDFIPFLQEEGSIEEIIAMTELMKSIKTKALEAKLSTHSMYPVLGVPNTSSVLKKRLYRSTYELCGHQAHHALNRSHILIVKWDNVALFKAHSRCFNKDWK